ncbi:MAG: adenylylsulfate reductase, partial [Candidatus Ornithomonoglobus sp.]
GPQKYVTGALAEGEIAAWSAAEYIKNTELTEIDEADIKAHADEVESFLDVREGARFTTEQLEEAMQTVMDSYAGGIKTNYRFNEKQLDIADEKILKLTELSDTLRAEDFQELMYIYELRERLTVCRSVIAHLKARHETRWHSFAENLDYPEKDNENFRKYVNSRLVNGKIEIILRDLVEGGTVYEHNDQ